MGQAVDPGVERDRDFPHDVVVRYYDGRVACRVPVRVVDTEYEKDTRAPLRLNGEYARDEAGQAAYLRELLEAFEAGGIDSAFVFTFALYDYPHHPDGNSRNDLDLASYGIVKVVDDRHGDTYPDMPWEPKAAFVAIAEHYRRH